MRGLRGGQTALGPAGEILLLLCLTLGAGSHRHRWTMPMLLETWSHQYVLIKGNAKNYFSENPEYQNRGVLVRRNQKI